MGAAERRYPSLRVIHTGSAPFSLETLRRARRRFDCDVLQGYGLTEATGGVTAMEPATTSVRAGRPRELLALGWPTPVGTAVRIVDKHDRPLPPGASGRVVVRGPS